MLLRTLIPACILYFSLHTYVVQGQSKGIAEIDNAVSEKKYEQAESILQSVIGLYYSERKADSLVNYVFYVGKVEHAKAGVDQAVKKLELFIDKIKSLSPGSSTLRQAYINAGEYYGFAGKNNLAYKANKEAHKYTLLMPGKTRSQLGQVENNLSTYAQRMGDLNLSQAHTRNALRNFETDPKPNVEGLYIAYNGIASSMWYASKIDSSLYYFNKALKTLEKTPRNPLNQYFRTAIVQNNLAGLYGLQGKPTEAIRAMKATISDLKKFLSTKEPHPKKGTAITFQFEAIDNLAGIYKDLGDLKQAQQLLEYSYQQKQKNLTPTDPAIFISQILLGQLYFAMREFNRSLQYLNSALDLINKADGDNHYWQADACNTLAMLYDEKGNSKQAEHFFERADSLYELSLQGEYDEIYLGFLRNASLFYAENSQLKKALAKANKGYNYVIKTQGAQTLVAFYQLLNLSEVHFLSGRYNEALNYSKKGLDVVNKNIFSSNNLLDSIKTELKKPKAILLKTKAQYQLLQKKDVVNLTALLKELNEALGILERRKSIIHDAENISLIMADHNDLLEFVKKITLDLYKLTNDKAYIDRLVSLHESAMYNRIRSRLDKIDSLQFAHIPVSTQVKERQLKSAITASLRGEGSHDDRMQRYFKAIDQWNQHKEKLKADHPRYYQMRYATIFKSLGEIQSSIPQNTTLIRYFFIGKELFAFVADNQQKNIFSLPVTSIEKQITGLSHYSMDAKRTGEILHDLYRQLWMPLAKNIHHKKLVIIPDGILYNLNFEILTPEKITGFKDIATKSLLAKYTISYQYSLFLLQQKRKTLLTENFIAFAPGFTDKIKENYRSAVKDTMVMDNTYLSLLPQPFTLKLADKMKELLGGSAFLHDRSTENTFKANAGKHKIIHIGTHAEANNLHPEYSRLIFAKNTTQQEEKNSLYLFDVYNCDLTSNLTVLTACESGKPGYQDGEGMISLAHAFSYAGSESIITGLWKIDEESSAILMDKFYKNLLNGMPKDEALREAKLAYLSTAEGRMLAPQYWAGLILIGDTAPVEMEKQKSNSWMVIVPVVILLIMAAYFIRRKAARING